MNVAHHLWQLKGIICLRLDNWFPSVLQPMVYWFVGISQAIESGALGMMPFNVEKSYSTVFETAGSCCLREIYIKKMTPTYIGCNGSAAINWKSRFILFIICGSAEPQITN